MSKYDSRFENFFLNLRLNRAEFGDMAAYTLRALRQASATDKYQSLIAPLEAALTEYTTTRAEQLSGAAQESTLLVNKQMEAFREYVRQVERKYVNPAYDAGSPDLLAIFPKGRSWLGSRPQYEVLDAFEAFLKALDVRPDAFPAEARKDGRTLHTSLSRALEVAAGYAQAADESSSDLTASRLTLCTVLLRIYATLLAEHVEDPARAAAFFDFSAARTSNKPVAKVAA